MAIAIGGIIVALLFATYYGTHAINRIDARLTNIEMAR